MKSICFVLLLLFVTNSYAQNLCKGDMPKHFIHTRIKTRGFYCTSFTVKFPWRYCTARVCWRGSRDYPKYVIGTACGIRIACVRQGRSNRYQCRYY